MKSCIRYTNLFLLSLLLSCSKAGEDPFKVAMKRLLGTWDYSYTVNCGAGINNFTGEIVITESTDDDFDLFIVVPGLGAYDAELIAGPDLNPRIYVDHTDANGVDTFIDGVLFSDDVLEIDGTQSDDSPLFYCAYFGSAEKQ